MKQSLIVNRLKVIEPRYDEWNDDEILLQIGKILECGYEWDDNNSKFLNKEIGMYLNVEGLNLFKPDDITDFYERVWSKEKPRNEQEEKRSKTGYILYLFFGIIIFILYKYKILDFINW